MTAVALEQTAERLGQLASRDVLIAPFTTFRVGGPASVFVRAQSIDDLEAISAVVSETGVPVLVIGQGSNLLVADGGYAGLVVTLAGPAFDTIIVDGLTVTAGAGVKLPVLARRSVADGLSGLEWMVGVPGSVGGGIRMNAGGHGSDCAANVLSVRVIDLHGSGAAQLRSASELGFGYRHAELGPTEVVIEATFRCDRGETDQSEELLREIVRWRRVNQPGGANCGSVFTNPPGDSAGRLIDAAGLKGRRVGTASVSERHANFIQADLHGRAEDIWALIIEVRRVVHERFGVDLRPEVRTAGFDDTLDELGPPSSSSIAPASSEERRPA